MEEPVKEMEVNKEIIKNTEIAEIAEIKKPKYPSKDPNYIREYQRKTMAKKVENNRKYRAKKKEEKQKLLAQLETNPEIAKLIKDLEEKNIIKIKIY